MMASLRQNTAVILWILVFAFIGTIIFSWGMGGFSGPMKPGVVGKIDGQEITREQYEATVQERFAMERQRYQDGEIPATRAEAIRGEAWDALINEVLLQRAEAEADLKVSNAEIAMTIRHSPPPQVTNNPSFRDSLGRFDWNLYNAVISDPTNVDFLISLENGTRLQLIRQKIMGRLGSVIHISEEDLRREFVRKNESAETKYIVVANRTVAVDSSLVTDAELREAHQDRIAEFTQEGRIVSEFVLFMNEPTRDDTLSALRLAENLIQRVNAGESFEELAREYSDDPSAENGGDLGWFGKGRMVPEFEKAAFKAEKGELVGPILTQFGYHVIMKNDSRDGEDGEEVLASHILLKIVLGPESEEDHRNLALAFRDEAAETSFDEAVQLYGLNIDTMEIRDNGVVPGLGRNMAATSFVFERPIGEITPVYEFNRAWTVLRTIEALPASITPMEEVKDRLLPKLLEDHQAEAGKQIIDGIYASLQSSDGDLGAAVEAEENAQLGDTRRPFKANEFISTVGRDHTYAYVAFNLEVGEYSKPFRGDKGWYIVSLVTKTPADMSLFEEQKGEIYAEVAQKMQENLFTEWIELERELIDIEDYRYLYYTSY
jgi:peptidyl-prolyl cis-trans isomerase D